MFFYNEEDMSALAASWTQIEKLTASDKASNDRFGYSVAVSGDGSTIVVGAYLEDPDDLNGAGSAYVFTKTGSTWTEQKITASDKSIGDRFGWSVSVSDDGSTIVMGAYEDSPGGVIYAGSAYVFTKNGATWTQVQKITASDKASNDRFGNSIAISGDGSTIVVGAETEDPTGTSNAGSAYVFTKTGSTWTEVQKITASDKEASDNFGNSVSVSGDGSVIVVGAEVEDPDALTDAGSAYIYTKTGSTWTEVQKITASDKAFFRYFGGSVSVSGDGSVIVVGTIFGLHEGTSVGSAYVFTKTGSTWTEVQKIIASDPEGSDRFGRSVAVSGDGSTIVVGAYWEDPDGVSSAGSAYVFTKNGDTWTEVQKIIASDPESTDYFGHSVSVSGDGSVIVVGAYLEDPDGAVAAGSAYVFQGQ